MPGGAAMSKGYSVQGAKYNAALIEFGKLKAALEEMGCWTGNTASSIEKAYAEDKIDDEQRERWHEVRKAANDARH